MFGIGARYGALLGLAFVVIAFATAHRYWEFPEAAQNLQYAFLSKDFAIAGGLLVLFVTGAGRFSVDNAGGEEPIQQLTSVYGRMNRNS